MWESLSQKGEPSKETLFLLDWIDVHMHRHEVVERAQDTLKKAQLIDLSIKKYDATPQTAPWHCEGYVLSSHIERILSGLFAIVNGAQILEIEEFARHKSLHAELFAMQETIKEHAGTMEVFALVHDIAKPDVLVFEASKGSPGEREGFFSHKRRSSEIATEKERGLYLKLVRAFEVKHPALSIGELTAAFYDEYEIVSHNAGHARAGASDQYLASRERVSHVYRLSDRERGLLTFLIRNHIDFLHFFKDGPSVSKYNVLQERAKKAGFDANDAFDLMICVSFLDATLGCLAYNEGVFFAQIEPVINALLSQDQAAPYKRRKLEEERRIQKKQKLKRALKESGLSPDQVFSALNIPFGSQRGLVMKELYECVQNPQMEIADKWGDLKSSVQKAREILTQ
jgi:hypothetical protein